MPKLETYKKQAKLLVRWHRQGNFSIGGRIRQLARYRTLSDREALALKFPLTEAQQIIALETGEILSTHQIQPEKTYWRNQQRTPGRWPGVL